MNTILAQPPKSLKNQSNGIQFIQPMLKRVSYIFKNVYLNSFESSFPELTTQLNF